MADNLPELRRTSSPSWVKYLDVIVGSILTVVTYFPLARHDLGEVAGLVTILLATNKLSLQAYIDDQLRPLSAPVEKLSQIIDLGRGLNIGSARSLVETYSNITEPEFGRVKDKILLQATQDLLQLSQQKRSDELSTGDYYEWLLTILLKTHPPDTVRAVSMMFDAEWDDSEPERKFFLENLSAAQRGVKVERIFVLSKSRLVDALATPSIRAHVIEEGNNLNGYFVDSDVLSAQDPKLLAELGHGFIEISGRVALIDKFNSTGEVRGQVTMNPADLRHLSWIFERLQVYATVLSLNGSKPAKPRLALEGPPASGSLTAN